MQGTSSEHVGTPVTGLRALCPFEARILSSVFRAVQDKGRRRRRWDFLNYINGMMNQIWLNILTKMGG
jgi:hypothetical protein